MKYSVKYTFDIVDDSQTYLDGKGCSSLYIRNDGTVNVTIGKVLTLIPGEEFSFSNLPNELIEDVFQLKFASTAVGTSKIFVLRKFTKEK